MTVYFEDGFWHGLFEQEYEGTYQVCRVTFGQEPKEDEILKLYRLSLFGYLFSPEATVKQHVKLRIQASAASCKETGEEESFF